MIDSRLALFAIGALCGAVLFGWPRHSRFSRFDIRRGSHENTAPDSSTQRPRLWRDVRPSFNEGPDWRRSISHENTNPPSGPPPLKLRRSGEGRPGPTTPKPDIIPKPQPPSGRVVDGWGRTVGYIPRTQGGTPTPPPREP